jgi:outer membrane protein assembly factor BamB
MAFEKATGKTRWQSSIPNRALIEGQWSSPAFAEVDGVGQVVFCGGDGCVYSFGFHEMQQGESRLLWKCDCNGRSTPRNSFLATPVIYNKCVYIATGRDPTVRVDGGALWCIDMRKRGDISPEILVEGNEAMATQKNHNSGVVWKYVGQDRNGDGRMEYDETMHSSLSTVAIGNGLVIASDLGGIVHCIDAYNGRAYWSCDILSEVWSSPLIVNDSIFVVSDSAEVSVLELGRGHRSDRSRRFDLGDYGFASTPVVAHDILYFAADSKLIAMELPFPSQE